MWQHKERMII